MNTSLFVRIAFVSGVGHVWRVPHAVKVRIRKHRHYIMA